MSLNPVSYLQTWEHNLAAARHRYQSLHVESESDGPDETYHDLPESSSSSASFLSRFSENSLGHRLNIYPYAGDEAYVRSHEASPVRALNSADDQETSPKTQGAYEVSHRKRIGMLLTWYICGADLPSASARCAHLLLPLIGSYIRLRGTQANPDQRGCI